MSVLPPEVMAELQAEYVKNFSEKIAAINDGVQKRDWLAVMEVFHKMAGSGATYKMPEVSTLARAIELHIKRKGNPDIDTFNTAWDIFKKVLDGRRAGAPLQVENHPILAALEK
jgi:HPt (histidine-containing phosphotransfer) domain-containing protein